MIDVLKIATENGRWMSLAMGLVVAGSARSEELASPWVEGFNSKVRLIAGKAGTAARNYAGLEMSMPPGWKTYWRNPGEAGGVPPEFDFSGSENLEKAEVLYPAPHRLLDPKAGENIGYKERVTFPIAVTAKDVSKPVSLNVKAAYGVCKDICVPAEAALNIVIAGDADASADLNTALASVPLPSDKVDAKSGPLLKSWTLDHGQKAKLHLVTQESEPSQTSDAFLFSPDGLYLPMTKKIASEPEGVAYEADLSEGVDLNALKGKSISVTLVGTKGQSETVIRIP